MSTKKTAKKTAKKATSKKSSAPKKTEEQKKVEALKKELKGYEDQVDFEYPEDESVEALEALLAEVKEAVEDAGDEGDDDASDDDSSDEEESEDADSVEEEEESDEEEDEGDNGKEDEDDDYDGDPSLERPTDLSKEDRDRIAEEGAEITGDAIDIIEGNEYIRTYSKVEHGKDYKKLAEGFVAKRNDQFEEKKSDRRAKAVDSADVERVFVVYRREVGKGDNRRTEMQKVQFSLAKDGPKFKAMAIALKVKVANTPGQDGPGSVVIR